MGNLKPQVLLTLLPQPGLQCIFIFFRRSQFCFCCLHLAGHAINFLAAYQLLFCQGGQACELSLQLLQVYFSFEDRRLRLGKLGRQRFIFLLRFT